MSEKYSNKYYNGDGGLFFNGHTNELFILEPAWARLYDKKKNKFVAKMYDLFYRDKTVKNTAVMRLDKKIIYIGEL